MKPTAGSTQVTSTENTIWWELQGRFSHFLQGNINHISEFFSILNAYGILLENFDSKSTDIIWKQKIGDVIPGKIRCIELGSYPTSNNTIYVFELMELSADSDGVFIAPHNHQKDKLNEESQVTEYYVFLKSGKWLTCKPGKIHCLTVNDVIGEEFPCQILSIKVISTPQA